MNLTTFNDSPSEFLSPDRPRNLPWRTTASHSVKEMMRPYREIYFAGFPAVADDGAPTPYPEAVIRSMFTAYGPIVHFTHDPSRGMGAVTFEDGEDAEHCYVDLHLSVIPGGTRSGTSWLSESFGAFSVLIYLEFAQFLPFLNPLLFEASLSPASLTRKLLRTYPALDESMVNTVSHVLEGPNPSLPGATHFLTEKAIQKQIKLLVGSMGSKKITMLDLWDQYVQQFSLNKTQPDEAKIKNLPAHRFASKASVLQQLRNAIRGNDEAAELMLKDDELHKTMSFLSYHCRAMHDPSIVSYWRALGWATQPDDSALNDKDALETAEQKFLKADIFQLATNLLKNGSSFAGGSESFQNAATLLDQYATSGSVESLMMLCSPPDVFEGPKGFGGSRPTVRQIVWHTVRYPLLLVLAIVLIILFVR